MPMHATQVATLLRLLSGTEHYSSLFWINWFTPYWMGYLLTAGLAKFLPIILAIKCIISIAIAATPWAASKLRLCVTQDSSWDWLFLPIGYGVAFNCGLLNFIIGTPIALLSIAYIIQYLSMPNIKSGFIVFLLGVILFSAHILIFMLVLLVAIEVEVCNTKNFRVFFLKLLPLFLLLPVIAIWSIQVASYDTHSFSAIEWRISINRTLRFLPDALGLNYKGFIGIQEWIAGCLPVAKYFYGNSIREIISFFNHNALCWVMISAFNVVAWAAILSPRFIYNWRLLPFLTILTICIIGPDRIFNTLTVSERFSAFLLPFYVLSIDHKSEICLEMSKRRTKIFSFLSCVLLLAIASCMLGYEKDMKGLTAMIKIMRPNRTLMTVIYDAKTHGFNYLYYYNTGSWYQAEKGGLGDHSFSYFNLIVQYRRNSKIYISDRQFEVASNADSFNWRSDGNNYDYFMVRGEPLKLVDTLAHARNYAHLLYTDGTWSLFERYPALSN